MLVRWNPKARNVPISPVLFATAAYMVIMAPMVAAEGEYDGERYAEDAAGTSPSSPTARGSTRSPASTSRVRRGSPSMRLLTASNLRGVAKLEDDGRVDRPAGRPA